VVHATQEEEEDMGSHNVTCHPTQANAPVLTPADEGWYSISIPEGWKAELT